jgi:hypothetical protein
VIVAQPLPQVRRQQQLLIHVVRTKCFAHGPQFTYSLIAVYIFFPTDSSGLPLGDSAMPALPGSMRASRPRSQEKADIRVACKLFAFFGEELEYIA